jgi:hypothetical protein
MLTNRLSMRLLIVTAFLSASTFADRPALQQRSRGAARDIGTSPPADAVERRCGPLPEAMRPAAELFIKDHDEGGDKLPGHLKTREQIVEWISAQKPPDWSGLARWPLFKCYEYRGYLFLTIRVSPHQRPGVPANLATSFIVDLKKKTVRIILLVRT